MSERVDYCKTCWHSAPGHKADCPVAPAAAAQVVDRAMKDAATRAAIQTLDELVAERDTLRADLAEGKEQFSALDEQHHNLLRSEEALRADLAAAHTALAGRDALLTRWYDWYAGSTFDSGKLVDAQLDADTAAAIAATQTAETGKG